MPLFFDVLFLYFVKSAQKNEKDELVSREGEGASVALKIPKLKQINQF